MTYLKQLVCAFVVLLLLVPPADAQPTGVWEHRFVDHTVYLRIDPPVLEVWRVGDLGECMMMPSVVQWDEESIVHSAGTTWQTDRRSDTLTVALPDTTLDYRRTGAVPRDQCGESEEI